MREENAEDGLEERGVEVEGDVDEGVFAVLCVGSQY